MDGLTLGPLTFRWGGLLLIIGMAVGILVSLWRARRSNLETGLLLDLFPMLLIWGVIGARLWHIFTPPLSSVELGLTTSHYLSNPLDIFSLWIGGYGLPGALLAAGVVVYFFVRSTGLDFLYLTDLLAPGACLSLIIGRIGNYFNQEIYGLPTNLPWGILIDESHRLTGYETAAIYHPLFSYEAGLTLLFLIPILVLARKRNFQKGVLSASLLLAYSAVRIGLEFLRLDVSLAGTMNINQFFFLITFILSAGFLFIRRGRLTVL